MDLKQHWEKVYSTKASNEVSWYQPVPATSLAFIRGFALPKSAAIIDVGGGDSALAKHLLAEGYTDITVVDISAHALARAQQRMGENAKRVHWIVADICSWQPQRHYDLWHDRAVFHFMRSEEQLQAYLSAASGHVRANGWMTIGTFAEDGPEKCSGLEVRRYSDETLEHVLANDFRKLKCIREDHRTPFNTTQHFLFCSFSRKAA